MKFKVQYEQKSGSITTMTINANSESEARAKFRAGHRDCTILEVYEA